MQTKTKSAELKKLNVEKVASLTEEIIYMSHVVNRYKDLVEDLEKSSILDKEIISELTDYYLEMDIQMCALESISVDLSDLSEGRFPV